ncbi:MAG: cell division protein FtsQ/DivIB [Bauldia sp.]|nr:cell division protein FtsQ/DivIB [Bauldia sp.]
MRAMSWMGAMQFGDVAPLRFRVAVPATVLPQVLRRPARLISRIDVTLPKRAGLKASLAFLAAVGLYGVIAGNHVNGIIGGLSSVAGLAVDAVRITGQSETAELDILRALELPNHGSIVFFDAEAARGRLEALAWVESATIRKVYPSTLDIQVTEREPYALWQRDGQVVLIDADGHVISDYVAGRFQRLPLVVGEGAPEAAPELLALLAEFPSLQEEVRAATLVSGRRWDLTLRNGMTVHLPEDDLLPAIIQLVSLDQGNQLFARDIEVIDLRMADRMTVQLAPDVLEDVEDAVTRARRTGGTP